MAQIFHRLSSKQEVRTRNRSVTLPLERVECGSSIVNGIRSTMDTWEGILGQLEPAATRSRPDQYSSTDESQYRPPSNPIELSWWAGFSVSLSRAGHTCCLSLQTIDKATGDEFQPDELPICSLDPRLCPSHSESGNDGLMHDSLFASDYSAHVHWGPRCGSKRESRGE